MIAVLCPAVPMWALMASCSGKETSSGVNFKPTLSAVATKADPVVSLISTSLLEQFGPQSSMDTVLAGIHEKFRPDIDDVNGSVCATLQNAAKKYPSKERSENFQRLRDASEATISDVFVAKLLQGTLAAPPERQAQLIEALPIEGIAPDRSTVRGIDALKNAGLIDPQGAFRIPDTDSPEYTTYSDWLSNNSAFSGLVTQLVSDFHQGLPRCYPLS
jgi:hypothetical protein